MMYPYMTLADETEIVHSQIIEKDGIKKVIVNFERPTENGFDSARCELPDYKWTERIGYSDEEIEMFEQLLHSNAHLLYKYAENGGNLATGRIQPAENAAEKALMLQVLKFNEVINNVYAETAPHKLCAYIYDLANEFNKFYHETKILSEEDEVKKSGYIALLSLAKQVLETCIDLLGFTAPERM